MAKTKKETFEEMMADLQKKAITTAKPVAAVEERRYFLIVCEGKKTEPIYFDYWKSYLPPYLLETVEVIGQGDNTINIVEEARDIRDARKSDQLKPSFDEVWVIFDKDDFPEERFNRAVLMAQELGIQDGSSNEAFELWYVLHFQLLQTAVGRKDYIAILSKLLGYNYEKNSKQVVEHLFKKGNVHQAIKWAKALKKMHAGKTPSDSCPSTNVYRLVENLLDYFNWKEGLPNG